MSDEKIIELIYENTEILHQDYEINEIKTYIKDNIVYTIIEYYKNNNLYRKVFENKLY